MGSKTIDLPKGNEKIRIADVLDSGFPTRGVMCNKYPYPLPYTPEELPGYTCKFFEDNKFTEYLELQEDDRPYGPLQLTYLQPHILFDFIMHTSDIITYTTSDPEFFSYGHGTWIHKDKETHVDLSLMTSNMFDLNICSHSECYRFDKLHANDIGFLIQTPPSDKISRCPSNSISIVVGEEEKCIITYQTIPEGDLASQFVQFPPSTTRKFNYFIEPSASPSSGFYLTVERDEEIEVHEVMKEARAQYEITARRQTPRVVGNCNVYDINKVFPDVAEHALSINFNITSASLLDKSKLLFNTPSRSYHILADVEGFWARRFSLAITRRRVGRYVEMSLDYRGQDWSKEIKAFLGLGYDVTKTFPRFARQSETLTLRNIEEKERRASAAREAAQSVNMARARVESLGFEAGQQPDVEARAEGGNKKEMSNGLVRLESGEEQGEEGEHSVRLNSDEGANHTSSVIPRPKEEAAANSLEGGQEVRPDLKHQQTKEERQENPPITQQQSRVEGQGSPPNTQQQGKVERQRIPPNTQQQGKVERQRIPLNTHQQQSSNVVSQPSSSERNKVRDIPNSPTSKGQSQQRKGPLPQNVQGQNGGVANSSPSDKKQSNQFPRSTVHEKRMSRPSDSCNNEDDSYSEEVLFRGYKKHEEQPPAVRPMQVKGGSQQDNGGEGEMIIDSSLEGKNEGKSSLDRMTPYVIAAVLVVALILFLFFGKRMRRARKEKKERENSVSEEFLHNNSV